MTDALQQPQGDEDSHGAWQAQVAELERMAADERARFRAAHPGYEQCPVHPERPVVDSGVCTLRFCAECVQAHIDNYADTMREREIQRGWSDEGERMAEAAEAAQQRTLGERQGLVLKTGERTK